MRESAADKAKRLLGEGRIIVERVDATTVHARARGDGAIYQLAWQAGTWSCTCPARTDACSHLRALRLVTAPDDHDDQPSHHRAGP